MKVSVILPAAGLGTRWPHPTEKAGTSRKQFMLLDGQPILDPHDPQFAASPGDEIVIALRARRHRMGSRAPVEGSADKPIRLVEGGRQPSAVCRKRPG